MASEVKREGQEATYYNEALHEKINLKSYETHERNRTTLVSRNEETDGKRKILCATPITSAPSKSLPKGDIKERRSAQKVK